MLGERAGHSISFPEEISAISKTLAPGTEIELWWQDEARIGQKNKMTRRWAQRGTRPSAPQRSANAMDLHIRGDLPEEG
jgi:hypothetical protein